MRNAGNGPVPPIVFAVDDNYVPQLCVVVRSLAATNSARLGELHAIVIHDDSLGRAQIQRLSWHADDVGLHLELRHTEYRGEGYPLWGWISPAAYLRLTIDQMLPEYDRAVYVDCDTLVLGDLSPLLHTELGSSPLAAVQDPLIPVLRCGLGLPRYKDLGLDGARQYFNSGVLVFNLRWCRENETLARALHFLRTKPEYVLFPDQDALNWVADDDWVRLDARWNAFPISVISQLFDPLPCAHEMQSLDVLLDIEKNARILHYAGPHKPWSDQFPAGAARDRYAAVMREVEARGPPDHLTSRLT